jgi:hypothetical protein
VLEEAPLDPAVHDRAGFDCGVPALNDYLRRDSDQHRRALGVACVTLRECEYKGIERGPFRTCAGCQSSLLMAHAPSIGSMNFCTWIGLIGWCAGTDEVRPSYRMKMQWLLF